MTQSVIHHTLHYRMMWRHQFVCWCVDWQAHVVAAFEQSLSNMTHRLQQLTVTSQQKVHSLPPSLCPSVSLSLRLSVCDIVHLYMRFHQFVGLQAGQTPLIVEMLSLCLHNKNIIEISLKITFTVYQSTWSLMTLNDLELKVILTTLTRKLFELIII